MFNAESGCISTLFKIPQEQLSGKKIKPLLMYWDKGQLEIRTKNEKVSGRLVLSQV